MSTRFAYDQLTGRQLRALMDEAGIRLDTLARLTGHNRRTLQRWGRVPDDAPDKDRPPHWIVLLLVLLQHPGAQRRARHLAAHMIREDKKRPDRGLYPYRDGALPDDDDGDEEGQEG